MADTAQQTPDRDGFVVMHNTTTKAEARFKPQSVKTWEARGWTPGPLSPQAVAAAGRTGVTPVRVDA